MFPPLLFEKEFPEVTNPGGSAGARLDKVILAFTSAFPAEFHAPPNPIPPLRVPVGMPMLAG